MSGTTLREAPGWRFVPTRHGDTLQTISLRELGDAARWAELASLNGLIPPYLTDDPLEATASSGKIRLYGEAIRVFAPNAVADADTDPEEVFGADIALTDGRMTVTNGDFAIAAGLPNLQAALNRRVITEKGELLFHADYGSRVRALLGKLNGPTAAALAGRAVRLALEQDPRVDRVVDVKGTPAGDRLIVSAAVIPIGSTAATTISAEF